MVITATPVPGHRTVFTTSRVKRPRNAIDSCYPLRAGPHYGCTLWTRTHTARTYTRHCHCIYPAHAATTAGRTWHHDRRGCWTNLLQRFIPLQCHFYWGLHTHICLLDILLTLLSVYDSISGLNMPTQPPVRFIFISWWLVVTCTCILPQHWWTRFISDRPTMRHYCIPLSPSMYVFGVLLHCCAVIDMYLHVVHSIHWFTQIH